MVTDALTPVIAPIRAVLAARPAGLLTDIDGTISLIAPTPDAAVVSAEARQALALLAERLDVVAAITGRAAENAERMVAVPRLTYIGNHGLEQRRGGATEINARAVFAIGAVTEALIAVEQAAVADGLTEGILYENKGVTGSIHYRLAPDQARARDGLLPIVQTAAAARGLRVSEGRMVIEIRPAIAINKGTAVEGIVERDRLRGVVFLGDDVTDIDAFNVVKRLRDAGAIQGINVAVTAPESLPEVAAAADVIVQGVAACVELLTALAAENAEDQRDLF